MNLLEQALERTEKHGWCEGQLLRDDGRACVEGHVLLAHGHYVTTPKDHPGLVYGNPAYKMFGSDGCPECRNALIALHEAGACQGDRCRRPPAGVEGSEADTRVPCVYMWNDMLSMPDDEALYRDTLLRGAKLLDEVQS